MLVVLLTAKLLSSRAELLTTEDRWAVLDAGGRQ
jgi:hypothetical protein